MSIRVLPFGPVELTPLSYPIVEPLLGELFIPIDFASMYIVITIYHVTEVNPPARHDSWRLHFKVTQWSDMIETLYKDSWKRFLFHQSRGSRFHKINVCAHTGKILQHEDKETAEAFYHIFQVDTLANASTMRDLLKPGLSDELVSL